MSELADWLGRRLGELPLAAGEREAFARLLLVSDVAWSHLKRDPSAAERLLVLREDPRSPRERVRPWGERSPDWPALRRLRREESLRLAWRDALGRDELSVTFAQTSELAEAVLAVALAWSAAELGLATPSPPGFAVLALGKLGGYELNFSSDVDLVFVADEAVAEAEGTARLARRLARRLAETDSEGFLYRVDLRLRPFGEAGPLLCSPSLLEAYFQREGRDWERFAWIRARAVAGDRPTAEAALALARPFVFRRYLDYEAFAALRQMKAMLAAEVARRELEEDIKRGPGGIRELEFIVQALQLVRGGREPALQEPSMLLVLPRLAAAGLLAPESAARLRESHAFLRRLENRIQMLGEQQAHRLPKDPLERERIAVGLGFAGVSALLAALADARSTVREAFAGLFPEPAGESGAEEARWRAFLEGADVPEVSPPLAAVLRSLGSSLTRRELSPRTAARMQRVGGRLLASARGHALGAAAAARLGDLISTLARRSAYLALLDERPATIARLIEVLERAPFLGRLLVAHPVLLDRLLCDPRAIAAELSAGAPLPTVSHELADPEAVMPPLVEARDARLFEIGLAFLDGALDPIAAAEALSRLAEAVLAHAAALALAGLAERHGRLCAGLPLAVVGYGSLGALELSFRSDLDLVFLYDPSVASAVSDGPQPLERGHYLLRLVQRSLAFLGHPSATGALYEVDMRLRPEGAKGLPLVSLEGMASYQRERARLWEHQALLRARPLFGDASACAAFRRIRAEVLAQPRDPASVRRALWEMRERLRAEHDRSDEVHFDLKQGRGGLIDLSFALAALLLSDHTLSARIGEATDCARWLEALAEALPNPRSLAAAHRFLLGEALSCHLREQPRRVPQARPGLAEARAAVIQLFSQVFDNTARGE
ncbi:MAG: glutamate-ammonia-ligase adenylyltransferase [Lysobacterales bacterium]|nr:MAG: glutamate-ammonia-ligase adenylyltransferase [Xanthomonadales bacterium]